MYDTKGTEWPEPRSVSSDEWWSCKVKVDVEVDVSVYILVVISKFRSAVFITAYYRFLMKCEMEVYFVIILE